MDATPETESWIICPVCQRPNPPGRQFCQHCWGAIIRSGNSVPRERAEEISKLRLSRLKRRRVIRAMATSLVLLTILAAVVYPTLYYSTDIVVKPLQGLNSNSLPGEWAMFRHDPGHSGTTDSGGILPQGKLKWVFSTGSPIDSSPAVVGSIVYIGSRDGKLHALDAVTGAKRWEYETGSWVESSPAVVNGVVYCGSNDGKLYALNAHSGQKLWDFKTSYPIMSSPAVAKGIVYFGSDDYYIYALDAAEGTKLWAFDTQGLVKSSPVVANGIVYIGSNGEFSYALNALNGRLRLRFKTHYPIFSSPAVSDGTVYFTSSNGYLFAIAGSARSRLWEHELRPYWTQLWLMGVPLVPPPPPQSGLLWGLRLGRVANSSPVVVGNTLYIGSANKLLAIDLKSRQNRWEFEAKDVISASPTVLDTVVYAASEDGRLYALDAATGEKLWDFFIGAKLTSSPTVADGIVYLGSHDGSLYAIK